MVLTAVSKPGATAASPSRGRAAPPRLRAVVHWEPGYLAQAVQAVDSRPAGTCELSPCRTLDSTLNLAREKGAQWVLIFDKDGEREVPV